MIYYDLFKHHTSVTKLIIFIIWLAGILSGCLRYANTGRFFTAPITALIEEPLSFSGIFIVNLLPVIISLLLFFISQKALLIYCFVKSFGSGYCICFIYDLFNGCNLFIRYLLQFSGICMNTILLVFWCRLLSSSCKRFILEFFVFLSISVIIGLIDLFYIIPFLSNFTITR